MYYVLISEMRYCAPRIAKFRQLIVLVNVMSFGDYVIIVVAKIS
jgi:hypothetical protein